jgi:AcrR family transcriptional regulator
MAQRVDGDEASVTRPLSRKRRQTRDRLLAAALDAFAERGVYGTAVEDVCARAGFSRGAFYSNFSSKDELLVALYDQQASAILAALTEQAPPAGAALEEVVGSLVAAVPQDRRWYLVSTECALHAVRNPEVGRALGEARERIRARFADRVTELLAAHGREPAVPVAELVRWLFAVHEGGMAQAYIESGESGEPGGPGPNDLTGRLAPLIVAAATRPKR